MKVIKNDQPRPYDLVLGGENPPPLQGAVLGGISGVKKRLNSHEKEVQKVALFDALNYGESGLNLVMDFLIKTYSIELKFVAYDLLKNRPEIQIKKRLEELHGIDKFKVIHLNKLGRISHSYINYSYFFVERLTTDITLEMVDIPGGSFLMGSPPGEANQYDNETPQHSVTIKPFYLGKYAITQEQYEAIMGENPSYFIGEKNPAENITWTQAVEFCQRLSQRTGKNYHLPSESQWEYACRAGTMTPFYLGETVTPEFVNYDGNHPYKNAPRGVYRQHPLEVGKFPPNGFGLYDMHGNIWEWCQDTWHSSYRNERLSIYAPTDGSAWEGMGHDRIRVLRGGSWNDLGSYCRSAHRSGGLIDYQVNYRGFRVALS